MSTVKQVRAVTNACRVLEVLSEHQPTGVSEIARRSEVDKSAVQRILVTLQDAGWVTQDPRTAPRWQVAGALTALARRILPGSFVDVARPTLEQLRDETDETVLVAAFEDDQLVVLDVVESRQAVRLSTAAGTALPVVTSAAGRAIAAHLRPDDLRRLRTGHPGLDDDLLDRVRRRGWAENDGEVDDSARTVGAAVLDPSGIPVAALVVCAPAFRLPSSSLSALGERCARAAADIEERMGPPPPPA